MLVVDPKSTLRSLLILFAILAIFHFVITGSPVSLWIKDNLNSPQGVTSIEDDAIRFASGNRIPLPGAKLLRDTPSFSHALSKHGVELTSSGELFGLIKVNHWCGNDPVRYHVSRVNLASLIAYYSGSPRARVSQRGVDPGALSLLQLPAKEITQRNKLIASDALSLYPYTKRREQSR